MKSLFAVVLAVCATLPVAAAAEDGRSDTLVRFDGGIGETPVSNLTTANAVLGVRPGGQPWVIERLTAKVRTDGRITVSGRGLLLAGGNGIGTAGGQLVEARLFCDGVQHDTALVPLDADGDFQIDDVLTPTPPSPCNHPVLLIVNATNAWFAAGIPK
jgi:hypothetical protein